MAHRLFLTRLNLNFASLSPAIVKWSAAMRFIDIFGAEGPFSIPLNVNSTVVSSFEMHGYLENIIRVRIDFLYFLYIPLVKYSS